MASKVADIMTQTTQTVSTDVSVREAVACMRSADIGDVVVMDNGRAVGILTDRDIVVRVVAEGKDVSTPVGEVCSGQNLATVGPDASFEEAEDVMRSNAVRRLPVVDNNQLLGVLSLGDLAVERYETSVLADIGAAETSR